ncbi:MAG TPA: FAD-binding oxidoreductase, partial [Polyangiaceae bacterium]
MSAAGPPLARDLTHAFPAMRASVDEADRVAYARDLWPRHHLDVRGGRPADHRPGVVVWPERTEDVAALVRWASERGVALVPFGAGSGVCGGVMPREDVVVVDVKRMGRIRKLDAAAPLVDVEAGHMGVPLEQALDRAGFTLGHFPSSILCSTVGGWVAARSAGQCSGAYGKIEDMVAALECVTGRGDVVTLRRRTSAPDLVPLVVGSEGTMAVVTSATLRLHPRPESRGFGSWSFPTTRHAWDAMRAMFQAGLRPAVARVY